MATSDSKGKRPPLHSHAPVSEPMDAPWDEDTVPRLDYEDAGFDRVTAIPELPPEVFAKQLMDAHAAAEDEPTSTVHVANLLGVNSEAQRALATSPVPFELEAAVLSADKPAFESSEPGPPRQGTLVTTAPPPGVRQPNPSPAEPSLELDEKALDTAVAARGRWQRPDSVEANGDRTSLELDLSNLGSPEPSQPKSDPELREIADRYATGDYSGALVLAEGLLEQNPKHAEAQRYAKNCRDVLTQMYAARLGPLDHLVSMAIPSEQIRWLSLDHRAGFLLSLVDGTSSVEELLDISGMARLDALRILFSLVQERVIALSPRSG